MAASGSSTALTKMCRVSAALATRWFTSGVAAATRGHHPDSRRPGEAGQLDEQSCLAQPGFCDLCRDTYGSKTLFDAELGYQFDQVNLSFGVRNLLDTYPDSPSSTRIVDAPGTDTAKDFNNNFGTFPWAAASPFGYNGRYIYARLEAALAR